MIQATVLLRAFYSYHIPDGFNNADLAPVAARIYADTAYLAVRNIVTFFAEPDTMAHARYRTCKFINLRLVHTQQLQYHTQCGFLAYAGQS
jgi:hypothetical protein